MLEEAVADDACEFLNLTPSILVPSTPDVTTVKSVPLPSDDVLAVVNLAGVKLPCLMKIGDVLAGIIFIYFHLCNQLILDHYFLLLLLSLFHFQRILIF